MGVARAAVVSLAIASALGACEGANGAEEQRLRSVIITNFIDNGWSRSEAECIAETMKDYYGSFAKVEMAVDQGRDELSQRIDRATDACRDA